MSLYLCQLKGAFILCFHVPVSGRTEDCAMGTLYWYLLELTQNRWSQIDNELCLYLCLSANRYFYALILPIVCCTDCSRFLGVGYFHCCGHTHFPSTDDCHYFFYVSLFIYFVCRSIHSHGKRLHGRRLICRHCL